MSRRKRKRSLRRAGCLLLLSLLAVIAAALWFRDNIRDYNVDDTRYTAEIAAAAERYGLSPQLVRSVVFQESRFDPEARGKAGEVGLMQVLPAGAGTEWARMNDRPVPTVRELENPAFNLNVGCWYLDQGMRRYAGYREDTELALARYNAGQSRADKWRPEERGGDVIESISIPSTKRYVTQIMRRYRKYMEDNPRPVPPEPLP